MNIQQILNIQRAKSQVSARKLSEFLYGYEQYYKFSKYLEEMPVPQYDPNVHNFSRVQIIKDAYKALPIIINATKNSPIDNHIQVTYAALACNHQLPGAIHIGMFMRYIELMGTQKQKNQYLQKCRNYEIVGCYAQTQLGHGSDIRNLQTTATYDLQNKQWIINTPTLSSTKYWPGESAFFSNYALVFAQTISKNKNYGLMPFIVQIKDHNYNWLPNIEGGDIGPKLGYHAKQNGFMSFKNVRIPKDRLLSKYIDITDDGEIKIVGDLRIGYATMMSIRLMISLMQPKIYAQSIIIASRYSLYRKQFKDHKNEERVILDYQLQQQKIIPRIAEYYCIILAGYRIKSVCDQNNTKIINNDLSLLQETHSNLSFSKALFSEIIQEGMEICRRSCGGHGTSYYSGLPQLLNEYAGNNTHEGQNTVMYLQCARYILKNYQRYVFKNLPASQSTKYVEKVNKLLQIKLTKNINWQIQDLQTLIAQGICGLILRITKRMIDKQQQETEIDIINTKIGFRLQQLAQMHGIYFVIQNYRINYNKVQQLDIKFLLKDLGLLFGIDQILKYALPIIQIRCITSQQIISLQKERESILKRLRPHVAILLDSFAIPDKYIRSQLSYGNPYQNFFKKAKQCVLNTQINQSVYYVAQIKNILKGQKAKL